MKRWTAVALAMLVAMPAVAGDDVEIVPTKVADPKRPDMRVKVAPYQIDMKDFNFPSGLRIIMQADHSQPIVAVTAYVDRGSKDDPIGKEGIAHFVEHLWFRSEHGDLPKIWDIIADQGSYVNASTADDWTNYMTVSPAGSLPALLRLESLRITNAVANITEEVVSTEREVIRNELRMRKENGFAGALPYLYQKLYAPDHPYAREGIGSHESLDNCKLADIQKFVQDNYTPANTTIVVVGDFDPDQAASLIFENISPHLLHPKMTADHIQRFISEKVPEGQEPDPNNPAHFTLWPIDPDTNEPLVLKEPPVRIPQDENPPEPAPAYDRTPGYYQAPVERPTAVVAWTVPAAYHGVQDIVANVAANTASGVMYSRLWDMREEVYHKPSDLPGKLGPIEAGCFYWGGRYDSKVICLAEMTATRHGERVAEKMMDQIPLIWNPDIREGFLEPSVSRGKMEGLVTTLNNIDVVAALYGRATQTAEAAHYTGSATIASDSMNGIMNLEPLDVSTWASKYLTRDRAAVVILSPIPEGERVLDSSESAYHGATKDSDVINSAIDPARITPELVKEAMVLPPVNQLRNATLSNGMKVSVLQHGEVPILDVSVVFGGGTATDEHGLDEFSEFFQRNVTNDYSVDSFGSRKLNPQYDPLQIAGEWVFDSNNTHTWGGMRFSAPNLESALWILREYADSIRPYVAYKSNWIDSNKGGVANDWVDQGYWQTLTQWQHVNPDHIMSAPSTYEYYDWFEDIGEAEVKAYLDSKYQPKNAHMVVVGDVAAAGGYKVVLQKIEDYFGGWNVPNAGTPPVAHLPPMNPPKDTMVYLFDDPKNTQTDVTYQCQVKPTKPEERGSLQILGDVLDTQAWTVLREQSGVTYGAGAGADLYGDGIAFLYLNSLVQNDSVALAVKTFRELVQKAEAGNVKPEAVNIEKYLRAKEFALGQQSVEQVQTRLRTPIVYANGDWTYYDKYEDSLANVTVQSIAEVVQGCDAHAFISVTGPTEVNKKSLDDAGIPYTIIEWKKQGEELLAKYDPKRFKQYQKRVAKEEALEAEEKARQEASKEGSASP